MDIKEALSSIARDMHDIRNAMCEKDGGSGIYVRAECNNIND